MGMGGYIFNLLCKILYRCYGDCKDKIFLLFVLMEVLEIEGYLVLVDMDGGWVFD